MPKSNCPKCTTEVLENTRFCPECGEKLIQDKKMMAILLSRCMENIDEKSESELWSYIDQMKEIFEMRDVKLISTH